MKQHVLSSAIMLSLVLTGCNSSSSNGDGDGNKTTPVDTTPPTIFLNGKESVSISVGDNFTDPGATATDDVDEEVEVFASGTVDVNTAGNYIITYTASDQAGNAATPVVRTVKVNEDDEPIITPVDTTPPTITLNGEESVSIFVGDSFSDPGATASDDVDEEVDVIAIGTVDVTTVGNYTITYTASDKAGNAATPVIRTVTVKSQQVTPLPQDGFYTYGAGNVSTEYNPLGFGCVYDYGHWIFGAGVVEPGVGGCDSNGRPIGEAVPVLPQLTGAASAAPVAAHRWWGSLSFMGEMQIGNPDHAAYIHPDPVLARVSNMGVRVLGIPSGMRTIGEDIVQYQIPDPFSEVFDGVAVGNVGFDNLDAYLKESSEGAVTVEWQDQGTPVMEATFVHGSPYVFFKAFKGDLELRTFRTDGGEKGVLYEGENTLGIWTNVAGNQTKVLIVGEGETTFTNINESKIGINNSAKEFTLVLLPNDSEAIEDKVSFFELNARNVVRTVDIDYAVDRQTNQVTVTHKYLDADGKPVNTTAGLLPMHWKNASLTPSSHTTRSARGVTQYHSLDSFSYQIPFIGALPYMPSEALAEGNGYDEARLRAHISDFVSVDESQWLIDTDKENGEVYIDTYWAGKVYGQVAELAAISRSLSMNSEADQLINWLKSELADWFTANTSGDLDSEKYFVYDETWNTLLGVQESYLSHQQLNDHHFHYGYFVRAAAEICRQDLSWCSESQYGPMIELLIRDYAAGKDDPMFPYLRHFDPANGFSWASGKVNFARGNNNESTSEAANAYGAMVLYGLATGQDEYVERGMYLHASTTNAFWQYWNNIDGYTQANTDMDNFPSTYKRITTSIIWGDGATFSTWFSPRKTHILGIQGLPSNPLSLHLGQYSDYMQDYIALGLSESGNQKPSGLGEDEWRDIWWNITAMHDADAAISDYNTMTTYTPERGSSKAHTYHWLHAWDKLGSLNTEITADYPTAAVFVKGGVKTYVVYNFSSVEKSVSFSDGTVVTAKASSFTLQ